MLLTSQGERSQNEANPTDNFMLDFPSSRLCGNNSLLSHLVCGIYYGSPSKLIQLYDSFYTEFEILLVLHMMRYFQWKFRDFFELLCYKTLDLILRFYFTWLLLALL